MAVDKILDFLSGLTRVAIHANDIAGNVQAQLVTGVAGAHTAPLTSGFYAVWAAADHWVKVDPTLASDVTALNGYLVRANTTIVLAVKNNSRIGAVAAGVSSLSYQKITTP